MYRRPILALGLLVSLVLAACGGSPAASPISDPTEILTKSAQAAQAAKSVHVKADVSGSVALDVTGGGSATPVELTGTSVEGDVDLAGGNARVSFSAPLLLGLSGDLIMVGEDSYLKVSLFGDKYQKSTSASGPTGALADPRQSLADLEKAIGELPTPPTKAPDEKCGDKDCYRVTVDLPTTDVGGALGGVLGSAAPSVTGSGTLDVWVQKDDLRPAKLAITADAGAQGTVTATIELTNWDAPVSIAVPPADKVAPAPSGS